MMTLALSIVSVAIVERIPRLRFRWAPLVRPHAGTDLLWVLTYALVGFAGDAFWMPTAAPAWSHVPLAVQVLLALVALDLGNYVAHWVLHRVDFLWAVHQVHHSSLQLDWLATYRAHVLEQLLRRALAPLLLIVVGVPVPATMLAATIFLAWATLNHANVRLPLGVLERVLITPRLHRVHHTPATVERNLGTLLVCWDLLRGTLVRSDPSPETRFGLPGARDAYPQTWLAQMIEPLRFRTRARHGGGRAPRAGARPGYPRLRGGDPGGSRAGRPPAAAPTLS